MRIISKPSTARCNKEMYIAYLQSEPGYTSCSRLAGIMNNLSHDSVNRFLEREDYSPEDLYAQVKEAITPEGGVLSIDDTVLDKPYSDPRKAELIDYFWSGKHKRVVKGLNLITLYYTDIKGVCVPVTYRLYDKKEGKTKNDYFREMVTEVIGWGIKPRWVTGDAWYASLENLKFLRKQGLNSLFGIDSNRLISVEKGSYMQVQALKDWTEAGHRVYLKDYGKVKVFRQEYKKVAHYYIMSVANLEHLDKLEAQDFQRVHEQHWNIERYHRAVKQTCNIERFQVRNQRAIMNHVFCAICAFVQLELLRVKQTIKHWYEIKRDLFVGVIKQFITQGGTTHFAKSA